MPFLPLTQGRFAQVDEDDYLIQMAFPWCVSTISGHEYAKRRCRERRVIVYLHREIMGSPSGFVIDHINGDTLDNRWSNLRLATKKGNAANRGLDRSNTSGYKGVKWSKAAGKWVAAIVSDDRTIHLGVFVDPVDAARAYNTAALLHFGEFARLNKVG
jgi:hypothetical protein